MKHRRSGICTVSCALLLTLAAVAPGTANGQDETPPADLEALRLAVATVLEETGTPAAGLVVLPPPPAEPLVAGIGIADLESGRPAGPDTCFLLGSISKSFVSLAALKLREEGLLDLEAPIRDLAPEVEIENPWEETDPVRVVHLLEHTAGFDDIHLAEYAFSETDVSLEDGLAFHPDSRTVRWRPGTRFSYSNSGPAVAAAAVENAAGQRFEDYVKEQFLDPLIMRTSSYFLDDSVRTRLATGYREDGETTVLHPHILMRPSGALISSPDDMVNFLQFLLNRGTFRDIELLQPASIERMETPTTTLAARRGILAGYGCGNCTTSSDGFLFHGHDGGIDGFAASYGYVPEHGVAYAYMINAENREAFVRIGNLVRGFLTRGLKRDVPFEASPSVETLDALTGYYADVAPRQEVMRFALRLLDIKTVDVADGHLEAGWLFGPETPLVAVTDTHFREVDDPVATVVFVEDDDGEPLVQGWGGPLSGTNKSISGLVVWGQLVLAVVSILLMASSVLFAVVWIPRWMLFHLQDVKHLEIRIFPLVSSISFFLGAVLVYASLDRGIERFGHPTLWSWGFYLATLVFAVTAVWGLIQVIRSRRWAIARGVWVHSGLVSAAATMVMLYLLYWGVIGLRTWAY